jgi:hypothetical protein
MILQEDEVRARLLRLLMKMPDDFRQYRIRANGNFPVLYRQFGADVVYTKDNISKWITLPVRSSRIWSLRMEVCNQKGIVVWITC